MAKKKRKDEQVQSISQGFAINLTDTSIGGGGKIGAYPAEIRSVDLSSKGGFVLLIKSRAKGNSTTYKVNLPAPSQDPEGKGQFVWLGLVMSILNLSMEEAKDQSHPKVKKLYKAFATKGAAYLVGKTLWIHHHDDRGDTYRDRNGRVRRSPNTALVNQEKYNELYPGNAEAIAAFKQPLGILPAMDDDDDLEEVEDDDSEDLDDDDSL